jgi:hypothetical protein
MTNYHISGNVVRLSSENDLKITDDLPLGNYIVNQNSMTNEFYLERAEEYSPIKKYYGDTLKVANRILNTFKDRPNATGVLLSGEKGSGKTLLAKTVSIEGFKLGIPTIVVNKPLFGDNFYSFIQNINTPTIILFDEFEKVYDREDQEKILTLFDGVFPTKKLFVLTCNDIYKIDQHMLNRPGRIFYSKEYEGLSKEFVEEYCQDNLNDKGYIDKLITLMNFFDSFNFDMLQAIVEEMNRYNETPSEVLDYLNIKPDSKKVYFDIKLFYKGEEVTDTNNSRDDYNPIKDSVYIRFNYNDKPNKEGYDEEIEFYPENINMYAPNEETGVLYKLGDFTLKLSNKINTLYDYKSLLTV